jgi:histidine ammonia-lyase
MHELVIGEQRLHVADVNRVARGELPVRLSDDARFRARLQRGADVIAERIERNLPTYGVNTGYGASVRNAIPASAALTLARNLPRYHGCGVGPDLSYEESRAVMLVRVNSLAAGYSGVRPVLLERLIALLERGVAPIIPARGSVGASGDLTPLSYVAALVVGERRAWLRGEQMTASAALAAAGIEPLPLFAKESMAIMNGTSVMSALACLAAERAANLARLASALTALAIDAVAGQHSHFDPRLFTAKAHPGQAESASVIRSYLGERAPGAPQPKRIQERYSLRCAPHVIGVLLDTLPFCHGVLENEINGASDNPLIDPESGDVLHGGNFYGGHMAMVADTLKTLVANLADLMDRQLLLLNEPNVSGLPENLDGDHRERVDGGSAEVERAGERVQSQHRGTQPRQGQHGSARGAGSAAHHRADRSRRRRPRDRGRASDRAARGRAYVGRAA